MATHVTEPLAQEERWSNRSVPEPHVPIDLSPTRIFLFLCKVAITYGAVGLAWDYARRSGLTATIHQPVVAYLRSNSVGLPMNVGDLVDWWVSLGIGAFVASAVLRSLPARLLWFCWGAWTIAMVSAGTPQDARAVAVAVATLAWAAVSVVALRGRS